MESVECLVVGAGVIGLAVARALARAGREVVVVESESGIGAGVSSRNSEVIHAGIYYPPGLDKTRLWAKIVTADRELGAPARGDDIIQPEEKGTRTLWFVPPDPEQGKGVVLPLSDRLQAIGAREREEDWRTNVPAGSFLCGLSSVTPPLARTQALGNREPFAVAGGAIRAGPQFYARR